MAAPPRVTAVVTGTHPFALLEEGVTTRLATIGDRIDGAAIVAITAAGVRLADGTLLTISKGRQP
jgi:hypothetical protein